MKAAVLRKWCTKRRGRSVKLARVLGISREFVRQLGMASRPVPGNIATLLPVAIAKIEQEEREAHAAALERIAAGSGT